MICSLLNDGLALPTKAQQDEQWRAIPGYEGLYEASDAGRVRTVEGKTTSNARYAERHWKQRILRQKWQKRGRGHGKDARVTLWRDGQPHTELVARMVARAWCAGYAEDMTVNHIDGNPENNRADNLEWLTLADNVRSAFADGLIHTCKAVELIDGTGRVIRFRSMADAGRYLGKNTGYVSNLLKRGGVACGEYTVRMA